jgi:hypothetical protein
MLADDQPGYPMTYPMEYDFSGEIDRAAFEAALEEAVARNPLLRARVEHCGRLGPCFVDAGEARPLLDWAAEGRPIRFPHGEAIDLSREVGLRLWVRQGDGRATLTTQFHHCCCDGMGAGRFIGDLFVAYGMRTAHGNQRPQFHPLEFHRLRTRGQFPFEPPEPVSLPRAMWATVCEAVKWATRHPSPLAAPPEAPPATSDHAPFPRIAVHEFDEEQSGLLRRVASQCGATVNDLLLRDLFLTMKDWNAEFLPETPGEWLQINMPQNLREPSSGLMPAANKMGYVFLARRTREIDDPQVLLEGIHRETEAIKYWSLGLFFITGLSWTLKVPGLCPWIARRNRCFATAVLSNLGNFGRRFAGVFPYDHGRLVLGNLRLESFRAAPPLRRHTHATLVALTYANRLNLNINTSPQGLASVIAPELLDRYVRRILQTISACAEVCTS